MENFYENLKKHFENTPADELQRQWDSVKDNVTLSPKINDLYNDIIEFEKLTKTTFYPNGINLKDNSERKCAYDGLDKNKLYGLVCFCPKCSCTY